MIYVASQYRLGAYGFLSSSEVRENGQANAGLLDQRSSLDWVQRNIRAFGGDPSKVTIIGGSAGGGSGESLWRASEVSHADFIVQSWLK